MTHRLWPAVALLLVLQVTPARAAARATAPIGARLDLLIEQAWRKKRVRPAPLVDDARFLRRIYLDLTGVIPPPDAVTAFLADTVRDKRTRAVDDLLASRRYADHFTDHFDKLLMGRGNAGPQVDRLAFRDWLHGALDHNIGWNQLAVELITAAGDNSVGGQPRIKDAAPPPVPMQAAAPPPRDAATPPGDGATPMVAARPSQLNGAVNWLLRYAQNPNDLTGKTAKVFLGTQLQCAQCHDHPSEKWKQEDFRRLAAVFARIRPLPLEDKPMGAVRRVFLGDSDQPYFFGDPKNAEYGRIAKAPPAAPDGHDFSQATNRRRAFAAWLTAPDNPWFARAIVNRMWGLLLGRGFVDPVDDFRRSNPPALPAALEALAADFVTHGYDLKQLIRTICATRAYQLAAAPVAGAQAERLWARYRLRPLQPEELFASLDAATHLEAAMQRYVKGNLEQQKQQIRNAVTFLFDVDEETAGDEVESTVPQALMQLNGELWNGASRAVPGLALDEVLALPVGDAQKIESLYLRTLSRRPTPDESRRWTEFVNAPREVVEHDPQHPRAPKPKQAAKAGVTPDPLKRATNRTVATTPKQQAFEDLMFALLTSSEFYFRH